MNELVKKAIEARQKSYSPYSKFAVGAALEAEDGTVFTGCNVENASYGLTVCAERIALMKAVSEGAIKFRRIAIVADHPQPTPCGACRQVLYEFAPELEIILANTKGETETVKLSNLLPKAFRF
ncbi:MAG: cytidine deaminase [Deltaproteobacteria bacterium]|nr:cytidine deaminase [Deltaproteobacteria bacterium]